MKKTILKLICSAMLVLGTASGSVAFDGPERPPMCEPGVPCAV